MISQAVITTFSIASAISILLFKGKPIFHMPKVGIVLFVIAAIVLIAGAYLLSNKSSYLPFLGDTAFPHNVLVVDSSVDHATFKDKPLKVTIDVPNTPDGTLVVYWASKADDDKKFILTPNEAYSSTTNTGVTRIVNGKAVFTLDCPTEYMAMGRVIDRHVHYRVQRRNACMFGPVQTLKLKC